MGCARCHDHKYDPFSQKDFYRLFAFFNGVPEQGKQGRLGYADPYMRVAVRGKQREYETLQAKRLQTQADFEQRLDKLEKPIHQWVLRQLPGIHPAHSQPRPT